MTNIPTSGDILRAFSRASMAAASRHIAEVLAGDISYDGRWRGAPRGYSAFTMAELQRATGLSERSVRHALGELARLFGLTITRRHHQRHLFRFTRIPATCTGRSIEMETGHHPSRLSCAEDRDSEGVTGSVSPVTPYIENKRNNLSEKIEVAGESNVHRTPWADFIRQFRIGTPAEKIDLQYLWTGFCGLNRRNGHRHVPLAFLLGFLRKYPTSPPKRHAIPASTPQTTASTSQRDRASANALALAAMASPAPFTNRQWHQNDLIRQIGKQAYDNRVNALLARYGGTRFGAELAVHGQAVREGEIRR